MAPASVTALGINELVNSILCLLPKKDLKSARLVRQQWASLGGQMLIETLYISPRKIDMDAFDGITQNPDLAKSVKQLVYDSAQFLTFGSAESYYARLYFVQQDGGYLHLGNANTAIERFLKFIQDREDLSSPEFSLHNLYKEIVTGPRSNRNPYGFERVRSCIVPVDLDDPDKGRLVNSGRIKSDGTRLIGSPSARAYPPTGLQPLSPKSMGQAPDTTDLSEVGLSNGQCELRKVVEVLHASGQKPLGLKFIQDRPQLTWNGPSTGASQFIFNVEGSLTADALVTLADNLRSLHLDFEYVVTSPGGPNFQILAQFLHKATKLEEVGLGFLTSLYYNERPYNYRLNQIFNPMDKWTRPALTQLSLVRLSTGFRDLSRLLFVNLPKLKHLHLAHITLLDGIWEDMVEGLHQIVPLTTCKLAPGIFQPNRDLYSLKYHATIDELTEFLEVNNQYAVEAGGTHPRHPTYELSYEFEQEIAQWKQLRADSEGARASE
ncbi:MAG: hypothetical protein LQ349_000802 [Xanthoria aureola]|nr:MAG: hypothetical protein LQ349_000802 [Xanthoria aureola]